MIPPVDVLAATEQRLEAADYMTKAYLRYRLIDHNCVSEERMQDAINWQVAAQQDHAQAMAVIAALSGVGA